MKTRLLALLLIYAIAWLTWELHLDWSANSFRPVLPILAILGLSVFIVLHDGLD